MIENDYAMDCCRMEFTDNIRDKLRSREGKGQCYRGPRQKIHAIAPAQGIHIAQATHFSSKAARQRAEVRNFLKSIITIMNIKLCIEDVVDDERGSEFL